MKFLQNPILRAIAAIVVGVLLLKFNDAVLHGFIIGFGILFLAIGILALLGWINERSKKVDYRILDADGKELKGNKTSFPIAGLGSLILGIMLTISSGEELFRCWMTCLLSAVFILGALNECMNLWSARKYTSVHPALWLCPLIIIGAAVFVICKGLVPPVEGSPTVLILGICALVYAVIEIVFLILFYSKKKAWDKAQEQKPAQTAAPADAVIVTD